MKTELSLIGFVLVGLSACSPVDSRATATPMAAVSAPTPTYGLAGQGVLLEQTTIAQERTRTAFDAAVVEATAIAQQTHEARNVLATDNAATSTAQGMALSFQQTAGAATQSVNETQLAFSVTVAAATQVAESVQVERLLTATAIAQSNQRNALNTEVAWWFIVVFCTLLAGIILWYVVRIGRGLAKRADPHYNPNSVRLLRSSAGPVILTLLPGGGFSHQLLTAPNLPPATDVAQFDTDEELPFESEDVPIRTNGKVTGYYNRAQAKRLSLEEEKSRRFLLKFLEGCMKVSGPASNVIPSHDKLEISTETWGKATQLLSPLLEKRRGRNGGTWLVGEHTTLREVFVAVGERRLVPRVIEHSPTPTATVAVD